MLRELTQPNTSTWGNAAEEQPPEAPVAINPSLEPMNNRVRLAQYRRKKAMKAINPDLTFPIEIYE